MLGKAKDTDVIRVHLSDWLFNAGILGFMRIISDYSTELSGKIGIGDDGTYIEFGRETLHGFTDKFFEAAFLFHGKYDSIERWLEELNKDLKDCIKTVDTTFLTKKYRIEVQDERKIARGITDAIGKRWKGVAYESLRKIKKLDVNNIQELLDLTNDLLKTLKDEREYFVEKEVQTFLRGIIGSGSFLNKSVDKNQKEIFKRDFEFPIAGDTNPIDNTYTCIHCNERQAKKNTIFSTGLVFYQGLNKDSLNFVWGFDPNLPLCEICELIYFCHWAGFTKGFKNKTYLFINEASSIYELWQKNELLRGQLLRDRQENLLINYFHELLIQQESIKSIYTLQNISVVQIDLEKDIMPKVISLYISRRKAQYIKDNHERLRWQAARFYKIKDTYNNVLREFLSLFLSDKLHYEFPVRLLKYYLQSLDNTKDFVTVNYNPINILNMVWLTHEYDTKVKQKRNYMESKHIWHVYHLGNDLRIRLTKSAAPKPDVPSKKINGLAYRLLNAVRSGDQGTFLNVLLRIYIAAEAPVPKSLVGALENDEKFQVIGLSYINGLLGEPMDRTHEEKQ